MDLIGIPWIFISMLFLRGSLIYCKHVHIFCGSVYDKLRPIVTLVYLVHHIFLKQIVNLTYKLDMRECLYTLYLFDSIFQTMDITNIIKVAIAILTRTGVIKYFKNNIFFGLYSFFLFKV